MVLGLLGCVQNLQAMKFSGFRAPEYKFEPDLKSSIVDAAKFKLYNETVNQALSPGEIHSIPVQSKDESSAPVQDLAMKSTLPNFNNPYFEFNGI